VLIVAATISPAVFIVILGGVALGGAVSFFTVWWELDPRRIKVRVETEPNRTSGRPMPGTPEYRRTATRALATIYLAPSTLVVVAAFVGGDGWFVALAILNAVIALLWVILSWLRVGQDRRKLASGGIP
jgi:hypothetical protein